MKNIVHTTTLICCLVAVIISVASEADAQPWLSPDWDKRIPFTADPADIEGVGTFTDFTLLLQLDAVDFGAVFASADSMGEDLVITEGDGQTVLDHEVVSYDPVAQTAEVWFKATALSDADNEFFLYYDNDTATYTSPAGVAWTPEHLAVYHFSEDPSLGTLADWGPNDAYAIAAVAPVPIGPGWTPSNQVAGAIGTGWEFDGNDLWAYSDYIASADSSYTISVWFANSQIRDKGAMAFHAPLGEWNLDFQRTEGDPNAAIETQSGSLSWLPDVEDDAMHQYVWTLDAVADTVRFYLDGTEYPTWFRYTPEPEGKIWTGATMSGRVGIVGPWSYNNLDVADGIADEYRVYAGVRDPAWVLTEYRNHQDPAGFYTVGAEEIYDPGPTGIGDPFARNSPLGAIMVSPNPFRGVARVEIETELNDVTVQVYDVKGRLVRTLGDLTRPGDRTLRFLWDGRDAQGTDVSTGIYYLKAQSGTAVATGKVALVR